jgi:hypothetical protein
MAALRRHQVPRMQTETTHNGQTIIKIIRDITNKKTGSQTNLFNPQLIWKTKKELDNFEN